MSAAAAPESSMPMFTIGSTASPSMDIQVASNFERYLYYKLDEDGAKLAGLMKQFSASGKLTVPVSARGRVDDLFIAGVGSTPATLEIIGRYYREHKYLLDPHTAVGVSVAEKHLDPNIPTLCLATAHPAKFSRAIEDATGVVPHHEILDNLAGAPTRCTVLPADKKTVQDFITQHVM